MRRRRRYRLPESRIEIPRLVQYRPRFELSLKPAGFAAIVREPHPDGTETAVAVQHRDTHGDTLTLLRRPVVLHRATPQAFGAVARVPLARRGPELELGVITGDDQGCLAVGFRDRDGASMVAIKTPNLASTPIARSRLELAISGAAIGAGEGLGGLVLGAAAGYGLHRLIEALFD